MLYYSQEVVNNLMVSRSRDSGQCQWNWALLRDSQLSEYMGMIGSSHSMVREKIGVKLSVVYVGNWVIYGMNSQGNRQANPMLMV